MGQKKNQCACCPLFSPPHPGCCFTEGQNKQDKICPTHSSKETGVRSVTQLRRCPSLPHFSPLGGLGRPRPRMGDLCGLCPPRALCLQAFILRLYSDSIWISREIQIWFHFWMVSPVVFLFSDKKLGVNQEGEETHDPSAPALGH